MEKAPLMVALLLGLLSLACSQAEPGEPPAGAFRYELAYSTFWGGPEDERAREVIVYDDGSVLVGMHANSRNLPTPEGAFQRRYAGDRPRPFRAVDLDTCLVRGGEWPKGCYEGVTTRPT